MWRLQSGNSYTLKTEAHFLRYFGTFISNRMIPDSRRKYLWKDSAFFFLSPATGVSGLRTVIWTCSNLKSGMHLRKSSMPVSLQCTHSQFLASCRSWFTVRTWTHWRLLLSLKLIRLGQGRKFFSLCQRRVKWNTDLNIRQVEAIWLSGMSWPKTLCRIPAVNGDSAFSKKANHSSIVTFTCWTPLSQGQWLYSAVTDLNLLLKNFKFNWGSDNILALSKLGTFKMQRQREGWNWICYNAEYISAEKLLFSWNL
jgi:hypothetical protein